MRFPKMRLFTRSGSIATTGSLLVIDFEFIIGECVLTILKQQEIAARLDKL
jgi:hypothetical protein